MTVHEAEARLAPTDYFRKVAEDWEEFAQHVLRELIFSSRVKVDAQDRVLRRYLRMVPVIGGASATGDAMTTFLANEILDHVFSAATYTAPANTTTALYTAAPSDSGGGTEATGGGYARVSKTNNATNWPAASSGSKSNGTDHDFGTFTADLGIITHVGLFDGSTNLLMWGALNTSRDVKNGDSFKFAATKLVLAFT